MRIQMKKINKNGVVATNRKKKKEEGRWKENVRWTGRGRKHTIILEES